jgi:hypothetical protein
MTGKTFRYDWTEAENDWLRANAPQMTISELLDHYMGTPVGKDSLRVHLSKLHLRCRFDPTPQGYNPPPEVIAERAAIIRRSWPVPR